MWYKNNENENKNNRYEGGNNRRNFNRNNRNFSNDNKFSNNRDKKGFGTQKREPLKVNVDLMENAILPSYATEGSAGLDLFSLQDITISSNSFGEVSTGVKLFLPHNRIIAEIRSRSSLGKKGLIILTNHFDFQDNGQEVIVKFFNLSKEDIVIKTNERIAQIVFNSLLRPEIEIRDMLDKTVRNQGGFGSTGK